ncbi:MAG: IS21-like element helper ATPase IstB [Dehalococcoidia bacterium]|nr:IS21-like element helper ATPase IstB [Dehalococcoidia bacterium]
MPAEAAERVRILAKKFRLPTVAEEAERRFVADGHPEALKTLAEVFEMEAGSRSDRRVQRLRKESHLPPGKTFATLETERLPPALRHKLSELALGNFALEAQNVLAFGLPGTGKTHAMAAVGHALVDAGRPVLFCPAFKLVQELLVAKRDLLLPRALRKLDKFEVLILDDIGYVQQNTEEVEVLFTLLAERYERRSLMITSNLVFSEWDQIFKNPMTTAAAIDRVVHHSTILEFDVESYRTAQATRRQKGDEESRQLDRQK